MSDTVICTENLGKKYIIGHQVKNGPYLSLRDVLMQNLRTFWNRTKDLAKGNPVIQGDTMEEVWALRDVSFKIRCGEAVGVIGRNGAGKSTLLKILSRIIEPSAGRATIDGRVASLLEVGTGFHPELTGRENIYLNGTILGMTRREIRRKFDEIVAFAEVEKYLDTPVKRYSSGMYVRLAFAVAAHLEPEILVVDEVLAVGDAAFQKKCLGKMGEVAHEGRTVLFVSHQLDMIRALCDRCILLKNGHVVCDAKPETVIENYSHDFDIRSKSFFEIEEDPELPIQIVKGSIINRNGIVQNEFDMFEQVIIQLEYVVHKRIQGGIVNFELKRNDSTVFFSFDTDNHPELLDHREIGIYTCEIAIPYPLLKPGKYVITPGTGVANIHKIQHLADALGFVVVLHSRSSSFLSFADKRPGSVAMLLNWYK
ncbi:lipopolysaccharide transport system ATP-binding protein [Syntrophus gentianae]|uniref:Lipopolysaccharide transport system ATP-binding protein n=1 Tax=Syntrophus gentianae TaxID=43775 RepID=A0A1H7WA09_9BACT|nr:ABC transporter ATP-binding protein [Syntrophus gentianae]SEM17828.1 lipopolysaccharide transport system ATP-binding protein [Syntrophus gentianae]